MADAVVVGAGHNGLIAANLLADAGWEVEVLEATGEAGGSVRTAELTLPGFRSDVFSAFSPLGIASPILRRLRLEEHGLEWVHAPLVVAHPTPTGAARCSPATWPGERQRGCPADAARGTGDHDGRIPDLPTRAHPTSTRSIPEPGCPGRCRHNPYAPRTARG